MSNVGLFVLGCVITAIVAVALAPLVWAAILDGRYDREQRLRLVAPADDPTPPDSRAA
jgi:hypothetical protein